jgi:tetratricopeptide (TPR) repeat protein
MLDAFRRLEAKGLLIVAGQGSVVPPELTDLWKDGLRTFITVVSNAPEAPAELEAWAVKHPSGPTAAYIPIPAAAFCQNLLASYLAGRAGDRVVLRIRNVRGETQTLDITGVDDPEHPISSNYELLQNEDLRRLQPEDLSLDETQDFFRDTAASWRPYAAGMPWQRDEKAWQQLRALLRKLDKDGAEANRVAFISAESGSGGTTLMRALAWAAAEEGYPTLVARAAPFPPKALEIAAFLTRIIEAQRNVRASEEAVRRYETPWLFVFDRLHWEGRTQELRHFLRELERSGRPACVLVVTGPYAVDFDFFDKGRFVNIANLSHEVSLDDAIALGRHLNRFMAPHGPGRTEGEWRGFYEASALQAQRGIAAFWIALSFWLQRQFDMRETVQAWIYRQFKKKEQTPEVRRAILDIAALSTERLPLPDAMLPLAADWPVSQKIEDIRRDVPALGLARISREGERFWAMAHDVIGRYLLTELFYDAPQRDAAGFAEAMNPEHLRFLALRRLSCLAVLGHTSNRAIAEEFAISIFKIDPDHGHANFILFWREVLNALDEMPKSLHATSRAFRHHSAISRRRIAKLRELVPEAPERAALLERAITDIRYALDNIPPTPDGEPDLNLYNSLALAYQDLADEEIECGAKPERVAWLRAQAHEATQRAYRSNPDNSFVIETYARSLISAARDFPDRAAENAVEVLNLVYAAMARDRSGQRHSNLAKLADTAITILLRQASRAVVGQEPTNETDALVQAISALASNVWSSAGMELSDFPVANRLRAAELLAHPILRGNPQAVRLRYSLRCLDSPQDFRGQLELLQSLQGSAASMSPQMRLELALLLHQCDRHHEAERLFRELRRLWRDGEHYVEVPDRLRWLMSIDGQARRQVSARVSPRSDTRPMVRVRDLQDTEVPFRPQEFGHEQLSAGAIIRGLISFGHNGPFLRPTTVSQS